MRREDSHAMGNDGKWYPLPSGWVLFRRSSPPTWLNPTSKGRYFGVEQHCDGFYVVPTNDGEPLLMKQDGPSDFGKSILHQWERAAKAGKRIESPEPLDVVRRKYMSGEYNDGNLFSIAPEQWIRNAPMPNMIGAKIGPIQSFWDAFSLGDEHYRK